jgi:hypothetical protein
VEINDYIALKLTHAIHNSEVMSYRACRRRWNWLFTDRWYPLTTAKPLEFGSAFHKALESWYDPEMWDRDPETRLTLATLAFKNMTAEQKAKYLTDNEGQIDPLVEEDFKERVALGEGMLRYHCTKVSPRLDAGFKPIRVEIEFEVPVRGPEGQELWCKCDNCWQMFKKHTVEKGDGTYEAGKYQFRKRWNLNVGPESQELLDYGQEFWQYWKGLPVTFGGRIDALVEDEYGRLWLVDWKTAARLSGQEEGDSPDEFIQLDTQITSYCWALWVLGIPIAGFIHHEIKKAFPVEPEPNKQKRKGCWYSVNKAQNTSYELYLETVSDGDPLGLESGAYDEFLSYLKEEGPRFYSRKQVMRSRNELVNCGSDLYKMAKEMISDDLAIYPSPGRFGCTFCAYRQPCIGTNRDEDVEYMFLSNFEKRSRRYWETTPASTDGKGGQ